MLGLHDEAQQVRARAVDDVFEVWPEHATTVKVFTASDWRVLVGMGGIYHERLDRTSVRATMELLRIPPDDWPRIFNGLRIMEMAARPLLNKKE